ncbi:MAG: dimethyl sulfoxide reductase anchor subunit [Gammaproteobacteria bacterium]|nr:dimethyl sulfoxide reductase anchor subunit [Gammaproteobacteria bacterium]
MHPAFSVIFLTTFIGAGQGLFLALFLAECWVFVAVISPPPRGFFALGSALVLGLLALGLVASFFHLGHPERAWRSAAMWRTSWLSREVIVLPVTMAIVAAYGLVHYVGDAGVASKTTLIIGSVGVFAALTLFVCTGMIYACIKFLQEWASPLTVINYTLLGSVSGFTLAVAYAAYRAPELVSLYTGWAIALTLIALAMRSASLVRNAGLRPKSTLQTAIGVRHNQIAQKAQGSMGGSFNTREFFPHASAQWIRGVKWIFLVLVFPAPIILLLVGSKTFASQVLVSAFIVQYLGLIAERWFFFAQANHPQNLYYQTIS